MLFFKPYPSDTWYLSSTLFFLSIFLLSNYLFTEANSSTESVDSHSDPAKTAVVNITDRSEFAAIIASKDLTVVDYWAPWCKYVHTRNDAHTLTSK